MDWPHPRYVIMTLVVLLFVSNIATCVTYVRCTERCREACCEQSTKK